MRRYILPLLCVFAFAQCKKDSGAPGGNLFQPLTAGSNWTYISNGSTFKITATSKDTVALNRTYKVLTNSNGPNQYQAQAGNDYFRFATFQGILPQGAEELYLKGDQNVNATWQFVVNVQLGGVTLPVTAKYTITARGISKTVQGKSYNDVVHVSQTFTAVGFGNVGGGEYFYAKGVGLISSTINISVPGNTTNNVTELVSYEIK